MPATTIRVDQELRDKIRAAKREAGELTYNEYLEQELFDDD